MNERTERYLLVIEGDRSRREALPHAGSLLVGRADDVDIVIHDSSVSRRHARITVAGAEVTITDLDSHNGTCLNGARIEGAHRVVSGDVVLLGEVTLVLSDRRPPNRARVVLDVRDTFDRLEAEVDRALRYERPLAVMAVGLGDGLLAAAPRVGPAIADALRLSDIVGWTDDGLLLLMLPELDPNQRTAAAQTVLDALAPISPQARIGIAACPADGCEASTLVAAARAAAQATADGRIVAAGTALNRLEVGERTIVVADPAMERIYALLRRLAGSDIPVLLSGETGVGKENAAYAVHAWSSRAAGPFVAINCAAIQETLVESELFGYRKGAFSGAASNKEGLLEAAHGGTVFLDELGELPLTAQAKLLRALDTKKITRLGEVAERDVDFRIVAATNRALEAEVEAGRFRQDLLFRLNTASVVLLPLRERRREIPILARAFLEDACGRSARDVMEIGDAAMRTLADYSWPGNVRELRNAMHFVAAAVPDEVLEPWHLPARIVGGADSENTRRAASSGGSTDAAEPQTPRTFRPIAEEIAELERRRMLEALEAADGVQARAAELIEMPRRTFTMKLTKYGLRAKLGKG